MRVHQQLIVGFAAMTLAIGNGPAAAATPRVGAPAPRLVVRTLSGDELALTKATGKALIVNVWATWCTPCRAEMPMLNAVFLEERNKGVALVGVSADRSRDMGDVRKAMASFAYPAALLSVARVDDLDEPRVLPVTYIVDRAGVVRAVFGGTGTPLTRELLDAALKPLLAG
jgi:thiol-disulfide isomerase/thioredoxin